MYFKEYKNSDVGGLKWPSENFFIYMKALGEAYFNCIDDYFQKRNVRKNICASLKLVTSDLFKDHIHKEKAEEFIIMKFVSMMIKNKIKQYNASISSTAVDVTKKLKHVRHE